MRKMRRLAKKLICLNFWLTFAWEVASCLVAAAGLALAIWAGDYSRALETAGVLLAGVGLLAFIYWIARDVRKQAARLSGARDSPHAESRRNGNRCEAAEVPHRPQ